MATPLQEEKQVHINMEQVINYVGNEMQNVRDKENWKAMQSWWGMCCDAVRVKLGCRV